MIYSQRKNSAAPVVRRSLWSFPDKTRWLAFWSTSDHDNQQKNPPAVTVVCRDGRRRPATCTRLAGTAKKNCTLSSGFSMSPQVKIVYNVGTELQSLHFGIPSYVAILFQTKSRACHCRRSNNLYTASLVFSYFFGG